MSFTNFIYNHINDVNNYVQTPTLWRDGRFAKLAGKVEATNGDFAEVVRNLPAELSREDVVRFFREDLYKGFVATIMWGGINRHHAEGIARNNDRNTTVPKLERLVKLLHGADTDQERIENAIATLRRGGDNYFYGIGPSYFTKLLYFLSYDMTLAVRPLIYDENMKPVHFALMPEAGQNPFHYYVPVDEGLIYAEHTSVEDVYYPYCELMYKTACKLGIDVKKFETWVFGRPVNINAGQPNPRAEARIEVDRMQGTGFIKCSCGIDDLFDAIGASRIFYDNNIDWSDLLHKKENTLNVGKDEKHPVVITETEGYAHLEYVVSEILFRLRNLESKLISQQCTTVGDRRLDRLCFEVKSDKDAKPEKTEIYFDITSGYNLHLDRNYPSFNSFVDYCENTLDFSLPAPAGYRSAPICALDSIFSIGVRYGSVKKVVSNFLHWLGDLPMDTDITTSDVLDRIGTRTASELSAELKNYQRTDTHEQSILKSDAYMQFLQVMQRFTVETCDDIEMMTENQWFQSTIKSIRGQSSGLSLEYLFILAGIESYVKVDRHITRFAETATGESDLTKEQIINLVRTAAKYMAHQKHPGMNARWLDHLIWTYQSNLKNHINRTIR